MMDDQDKTKEQLVADLQTLRKRVSELEASETHTERKRAEGALQAERDVLQSLMDGLASTGIGVDVVGVDYKVKNQNKLLHDIFGDLTGKLCYQYYMGLDEPCVPCPMNAAIKSGKTERAEMIGSDGRHYEILSAPLHSPDGTADKAIEVVQDITERRRAEKEIRLLSSTVEQSCEGMAVADLEGNLTYVNQAWADMHGYESSEELIGRHLSIFHNREQLENEVVPFNEKAMKKGFHKGEVGHIKRDGTVFPTQMTTTVIKDENGKAIAINGLALDITERRRAEEALRKSELQFRTLFSKSRDTNLLLVNGVYVDCNDACLEMLRATRDQVTGKSPSFFSPERQPVRQLSVEAVQEKIREVRETGSSRFEWIHRRMDGTDFWTEVVLTSMKIGDWEGVFGVWRDISNRKRAEEALRKSETQLKSVALQLALTEEKERRRIAIALHDNVGQILAAAKMKLEMIIANMASSDLLKPCEEVFHLCEHAIENARSLTTEVSPPILYELGLEAALEWLVEKHGEQYNLCAEFDTDGQDRFIADDIRGFIFQSVRELLVNATKHSRAGRVKLSVRSEGTTINICVEDDGVGFDLSEMTASDGFGLFNIRERLSSIGGKLEMESEPGKGTRVTMFVPLESPD